ncbi:MULTISPECIES: hypothetical protein [Actinosynnema]|uniref:Uncharacterized protein n=1 Tax=Actinosynnema pretiosum TaxID=42197 RepID=A0A290Z742_9PSEU|nr:hypothetical protein [Actinosynnema pretiosum]ATE54789.1 hypothetical protein CNX65_17130 [Actinosynnema pretiosum]
MEKNTRALLRKAALTTALSLGLALTAATGTAQAASSTIPGSSATVNAGSGAACAGSGSTTRVYYAYAIVAGQEKGGNYTTPAGGCGSFYPPQGTFRHFHICNLATGVCGPEVWV